MSTATPKLGLILPDDVEFYDVDIVNGNNTKIDTAIGTVICTSSTRPSTDLFNGMMLYETDTRRFVVRSAGAWVPQGVPQIIADVTARTAISAPYDGMQIYRQDRDWVEVYNGSGWHVQGVAACTSVADRDGATGITTPYNGQLAYTADTGTLWQRHSGAWRAYPVTTALVSQFRQTAAQALANATDVAITFTTEDHDVGNAHSTSSNTSRYVAAAAGVYEFSGGVAYAASASGVRITKWAKNGAFINGSDICMLGPGAGAAARIPARTIQVTLAVTDYVELQAYQDSGGSINTFVTSGVCSTMTVKYLGT